ncbi:MAG: diguanylate cyclase, partial [Pseudomonadota bacterium]|nr:diguanylate cyclase [Pseudomonadota bacterium]
MSLLIGALCGVLVCAYTAYVSDDEALQIVAWVLAGVALTRVAVMVAVRNVLRAKSSTLELLFEFGAFAYAGSVSLMAALAILHNISVEAQMVLVVYAVGYATAIAPRNAGRPFIAIGQLLAVMAPLTGALLLSDALLVRVLGVVALLHIPSTVSITINVYRSLRTSIAEAETNERLARKMEVLAHTDIVTGLHNRAGLNDVLAAQVRHGGPDQRIALFWLDLDRFKEVNDLLGHQIGDRVLSEIARRLRDSLPVDAGIARFGGDEFVFFCQIDDRAQCERLANRVLDQITRPMRLDGERLEVSSSIGIATMPEDGVDADRLMQAADLALYHAKQDGRGKLRFFDAAMTRELANRREIEAELRQAIQRDELSLFFQPIIDLQTGRIRCFEAL